MKTVNNYILLVDAHRRLSRRRNTYGRYRVGAKTKKEAIKLLREKIKFGSIQYHSMASEDYMKHSKRLNYKEIVKEEPCIVETSDGTTKWSIKDIEPLSATDPRP